MKTNTNKPQGKQSRARVIFLLLFLFSCKYSFTEDRLSQLATMFNLSKPQSEKQARIIILCDADTPTGVRSIRGTVMDYDSGAPIPNAFVSTLVSTEVYATDTEGKFKIQKIGMETTKVILKVTADTYKSLSQQIEFSCQNMNALIYLPLASVINTTSTTGTTPTNPTNPTDPTDPNNPGNVGTPSFDTCILGKSIYGACKL